SFARRYLRAFCGVAGSACAASVTPAAVAAQTCTKSRRFMSNDAFEELHLDDGAGLHVAGAVAEDDEAVRVAHRLEDARALLAGGAHLEPAAGAACKHAALEFR